jgi:hypothetical protein
MNSFLLFANISNTLMLGQKGISYLVFKTVMQNNGPETFQHNIRP